MIEYKCRMLTEAQIASQKAFFGAGWQEWFDPKEFEKQKKSQPVHVKKTGGVNADICLVGTSNNYAAGLPHYF